MAKFSTKTATPTNRKASVQNFSKFGLILLTLFVANSTGLELLNYSLEDYCNKFNELLKPYICRAIVFPSTTPDPWPNATTTEWWEDDDDDCSCDLTCTANASTSQQSNNDEEEEDDDDESERRRSLSSDETGGRSLSSENKSFGRSLGSDENLGRSLSSEHTRVLRHVALSLSSDDYTCRPCGTDCSVNTQTTPKCTCAVVGRVSTKARCKCSANCASFRNLDQDGDDDLSTSCIFKVTKLDNGLFADNSTDHTCECSKSKAAENNTMPDFVCVCQPSQ